MASVQHRAPNHWVVHLASRSAPDSEVTVELRMSRATAEKLAHLEAERIAALNPGVACPAAEDVGSAVLTILTSIAAIARVKERASALDQQELIDLIDDEVDAARADRA